MQGGDSSGRLRDSVSPRTARLRQKGLVAEVGTLGSETLYEAVENPNFVKAPGRRKPKAYYDGLGDAVGELYVILSETVDPVKRSVICDSINLIENLKK